MMHAVWVLSMLALPSDRAVTAAGKLADAPVHNSRALAANRTQLRRPPEHALRLKGGSTVKEGILQIYHDGRWGNICDDNWDTRDARVACRQLGLGDARDALLRKRDFMDSDYSYGSFWRYDLGSESTGEPIWMDNVRCSGTEAKLADCAHAGWSVENCGHFEDVAIRCEGRALARTIEFSITFFCVSTAISVIALIIAALTLHRVWAITRAPPRQLFAQMVDLQQSGLMPMTYAPFAPAHEPKSRSESLKHLDASFDATKESEHESDRSQLL